MDGLDKQALGARVAEVRRAHGLSQEQLAERLLVSRQTISNWERGVRQNGLTGKYPATIP